MDKEDILRTISEAINFVDATVMLSNWKGDGLGDRLMEVIVTLKEEWGMEDD